MPTKKKTRRPAAPVTGTSVPLPRSTGVPTPSRPKDVKFLLDFLERLVYGPDLNVKHYAAVALKRYHKSGDK